jgi:hypothetical protein
MNLHKQSKAISNFLHLRNSKTAGKALGGFFLIVGYSYGVFQESFWSDDYPSLVDPHGTYKEVFGDARPIFGLLSNSRAAVRLDFKINLACGIINSLFIGGCKVRLG